MRNRILLALLVGTVLSAWGCESPTEDTTVSAVAVSVSTLTFRTLSTSQAVTATALGSRGQVLSSPIVWSTSDADVATVTDGVVTARQSGTATITARAGSASGRVEVVVSPEIAAIVFTRSALSFSSLGSIEQVEAAVRDSGGAEIRGAIVNWSTSDSTVARVTNGEVVATGNGQATITARAGQAVANLEVRVSQVPFAIALSNAVILFESVGDVQTVVAEVRDERGRIIENPQVVWTSSDSAVANALGGRITAVRNGEATITARIESLEASATVRVQQMPVALQVTPDRARLTAEGQSILVVATLRDARGNLVAGDLEWAVSDTMTARMAGQGNARSITARRTGATSLVVVHKALRTEIPIEVEIPFRLSFAVASSSMSYNPTLQRWECRFSIFASALGGRPGEAAILEDAEIRWTYSDGRTADVSLSRTDVQDYFGVDRVRSEFGHMASRIGWSSTPFSLHYTFRAQLPDQTRVSRFLTIPCATS